MFETVAAILLHRLAKLTTLDPADCLLFLDASEFTLADKPAFAADGAQNTTLNDFLAEAFEQLILRFVRA